MTVGLQTTNLANKWLDMLAGTAFTAPTNTFVALHTGDPGANGTANASTETTRKQLTWSAASGGSKSITATLPTWAWVQGTETISNLSIWDAVTSGNFLFSITLTVSKVVANGDTFNITAMSISFTPLAA